MDKDVLEYLDLQSQEARTIAEEQAKTIAQKQFEEDLERINTNYGDQMFSAQHSPAFNSHDEQERATARVRDSNAQERQRILDQVKAREAELVEEHMTLVDEGLYEHYGGSREAAHELYKQQTLDKDAEPEKDEVEFNKVADNDRDDINNDSRLEYDEYSQDNTESQRDISDTYNEHSQSTSPMNENIEIDHGLDDGHER